jgi:hypothetical protein
MSKFFLLQQYDYLSVHFAVLVSKSTHLLNNFFKFWYYVHVFVVNLTGRNRQIHIPIKYFVLHCITENVCYW